MIQLLRIGHRIRCCATRVPCCSDESGSGSELGLTLLAGRPCLYTLEKKWYRTQVVGALKTERLTFQDKIYMHIMTLLPNFQSHSEESRKTCSHETLAQEGGHRVSRHQPDQSSSGVDFCHNNLNTRCQEFFPLLPQKKGV